MYDMWVHVTVKLSHVANSIISFQVIDWPTIFAQLLFHFYDRTNKTRPGLQKIEDLKGHDSFVALTQDEVTLDCLVHTTPYLARIFFF